MLLAGTLSSLGLFLEHTPSHFENWADFFLLGCLVLKVKFGFLWPCNQNPTIHLVLSVSGCLENFAFSQKIEQLFCQEKSLLICSLEWSKVSHHWKHYKLHTIQLTHLFLTDPLWERWEKISIKSACERINLNFRRNEFLN